MSELAPPAPPTSFLLDCLAATTTDKNRNDCLLICVAAATDAMTESAISDKSDADIAAEARVLARIVKSLKSQLHEVKKPLPQGAPKITAHIRPPQR